MKKAHELHELNEKKVPNSSKCFVGFKCQGRGVVSTPGIFFFRRLKKQAVDLGDLDNLTITYFYINIKP